MINLALFVCAVLVAIIAALVISHRVTLSAVEAEIAGLESKTASAVSVAAADVKSFIASVRAKL